MELKKLTLSPQNKRQKTASTEPIKSQSSKLSMPALEHTSKTASKFESICQDDNALPHTSQSGPGMMSKPLDQSAAIDAPLKDWEVKKAVKTAVFKKFLSRGGAKNPGCKDIPQGSPDCLAGLVFVLTGVFESLEREEMSELVRNLGGKVTTALSKNTKYLVVGEEAGESKLAKAKSLGTNLLTEDGLLDLIKEISNKMTCQDHVAESCSKFPTASFDYNKSNSKGQDHVADSCSKFPTASFDHDKSNNKGEKNTNKGDRKAKTPDLSKVCPKIKSKTDPVSPKKEPMSIVSLKDSIPSNSQLVTYEEVKAELWVDKYKPINCESIIGQQGEKSPMNKLKIWLRDWDKIHLNLNGKWHHCLPI